MTAVTQNRNTPTRGQQSRVYLVAAGALCYAGAIAVIAGDEFVKPAGTATGLIALGVFSEYLDNRDGADGEVSVAVKRGVFRFDNSTGSDAISAGDIGKVCYLVDDQTLALTDGGGTRSPAGIVDGVDDIGVWVYLDPLNHLGNG